MSSKFHAELQNLAGIGGSHKDYDKYRAVLNNLFQSNESEVPIDGLKAFIEAIVKESVSLVVSRQLLSEIARLMQNLNDDTNKIVAHFILEKVHPRVISFEEQVATVRQLLANVYEREKLWREAALALTGIPLETGQKQYSSDYKLETYLKISRLYLEDNDIPQAEAYINRASILQADTQIDALVVSYKKCYTRLFDYKLKFIEAAQRYYELSHRSAVEKDEKMKTLEGAIICSVLASAGQQRSRMLGTLYKDERCQKLLCFNVLEKMHLDRIIEKPDLEVFQTFLRPHHLGTTADGSTLLDKAVTEHNMIATSKIYTNIRFHELGELLHIPADKAETVSSKMISEGRMTGYIDQTEGMLYFEGREILPQWDKQIESVCYQLNGIIDTIQAKHPEWYEKISNHALS